MPHQSSPVRVPVDLIRLFFGPEPVSGAIARLCVTWFVLSGGWEADFSDRLQNLKWVRLASWVWPPMLWRVEGRFPPSATAVLLELQGLGLVTIGAREGSDVLVTVGKLYELPDKIVAELEALVHKREAGEEQAP